MNKNLIAFVRSYRQNKTEKRKLDETIKSFAFRWRSKPKLLVNQSQFVEEFS